MTCSPVHGFESGFFQFAGKTTEQFTAAEWLRVSDRWESTATLTTSNYVPPPSQPKWAEISVECTLKYLCRAVFRINDILGWIRIRIRGSMPLTNRSGSWIRILLFSSLIFKMPAKN